MKIPTPVVSVVMPVYNAQRYLSEAVESILSQSLHDFEFIVLDDGSTDRSLSILNRYAATDSRIRLHARSHRGHIAAYDELLHMARGRYIARMDADDIAMPDRLCVEVEYLDAHPECVCVGGAYDLVDERGRMLIRRFESGMGDKSVQAELLSGNTVLCQPTSMFRREILAKIGYCDLTRTLIEDLDMFLKMGELGELVILPHVVLRYREHQKSVSAVSHQSQIAEMRLSCEDAWQRRGITDGKFVNKGWRPQNRFELHDVQVRNGWWAFNRGDRKLAIEYGLRAVCQCPWRGSGWRLVVCSAMPWKRPSAASRGHQGAKDD